MTMKQAFTMPDMSKLAYKGKQAGEKSWQLL